MLVLAILLAHRGHRGKNSDDFPYLKAETLFSAAERSFLGALEQAVPGEFRVFGKVRIVDVANVKVSSDRARWQRAFNRISNKHFDFILCRPDNLVIVCAIELDDRPHKQARRKERDTFVAGVWEAISLPLLQVPAQHAYSVHDLRSKILQAAYRGAPPPVATDTRPPPKPTLNTQR
ncbi:DUF2726 domain-containing protein [Lysobacter sp. TAF61]